MLKPKSAPLRVDDDPTVRAERDKLDILRQRQASLVQKKRDLLDQYHRDKEARLRLLDKKDVDAYVDGIKGDSPNVPLIVNELLRDGLKTIATEEPVLERLLQEQEVRYDSAARMATAAAGKALNADYRPYIRRIARLLTELSEANDAERQFVRDAEKRYPGIYAYLPECPASRISSLADPNSYLTAYFRELAECGYIAQREAEHGVKTA